MIIVGMVRANMGRIIIRGLDNNHLRAEFGWLCLHVAKIVFKIAKVVTQQMLPSARIQCEE
jgi:hypothetical protein